MTTRRAAKPLVLLCVVACESGSTPVVDGGSEATTRADTSTTSTPNTTGMPETSSEATTSSEVTSTTETTTEGSSSGAPDDPPPEPWVWDLPTGFPVPYVPPDNPMSAAKVELGRHLFYDERLSVDGTYSCATCHRQELAFTDGMPRAQGVTGELHPRGAMSLANVAYAASFAWANPTLLHLEEQALGPLFGVTPVEMGLVDEADLLSRIADEPIYDGLFAAAYPDDADPRSLDNVAKAIASFERTLISGRSPFDRWFYEGDESAISETAKRGYEMFILPGECNYCHFSFNFSNSTYFESLPERTLAFHNTGLYNEDGLGAYPPGNEGLFNYTGVPEDMGKFKSPTLRNIMLTAPYMHDGSVDTLPAVLHLYADGGRVETPYVDFQMQGFVLEPEMIPFFMAFFTSLTDDDLMTNPAHGDPW